MNERSAFFCRIFRNENCFETYYKHVSNYQWIFMIVYDFGWRSWSKWFRSCHFNFKHVRKKVDDFFLSEKIYLRDIQQSFPENMSCHVEKYLCQISTSSKTNFLPNYVKKIQFDRFSSFPYLCTVCEISILKRI